MATASAAVRSFAQRWMAIPFMVLAIIGIAGYILIKANTPLQTWQAAVALVLVGTLMWTWIVHFKGRRSRAICPLGWFGLFGRAKALLTISVVTLIIGLLANSYWDSIVGLGP